MSRSKVTMKETTPGLFRVPGSRNYKGYEPGIRNLMTSEKISKAVMAVADRVAGNCNAVGRSTYEAEPVTVVMGWKREERAGARVGESKVDGRDARDAIMTRVLQSMRKAGRDGQ